MGKIVSLVREQEFSTMECGECGIVFAIETWLMDKWVNQRHGFHCPNGHSRRFASETEAERIKRELTVQLEAANREAEWARVRANTAEKQARAAKGQVTKLKKRVGNGVCPCCHRTFKQLAAHMATKHPEYAKSDDEATDPEASKG
jgi:hypothetical protein